MIYIQDGLLIPETELELPEAGQYFIRVRATNEEGKTQDAFDYYVTDEDVYKRQHLNPMAFLKSETFLDLLIKICKEQYPYIAFADAFHTMRSMLLPVLYLMGSEVPEADVYHAICTGYGGLPVSYTHLHRISR